MLGYFADAPDEVMDRIDDSYNVSNINKVSTATWKAMGTAENMQGLTTSFPANGAEVYAAVTGPDCGLIILTRTYFDPYQIEREMIVTRPKVTMGTPLTLPALNSSKIERLFHGESRNTIKGAGFQPRSDPSALMLFHHRKNVIPSHGGRVC